MADQKVVDYIKTNLSDGFSLEQIKQALIDAGWQQEEINSAIDSVNHGSKDIDIIAKQDRGSVNKKLVFVNIFIVIVFCLILGFFLYSKGSLKFNFIEPNPNSDIGGNNEIDCGDDFDCFIDASENCNPANLKQILTLNLFGVEQTTSTTYKILGTESDKCNIYLRTDSIDLNFPEDIGISQEEIDEQKEMYDALEGREGTCMFETNDLTDMLKRWKQGNFSSGEVSCSFKSEGKTECTTKGGDFGAAECNGTYFIIDLCIDDGKCPPGCTAETDGDC